MSKTNLFGLPLAACLSLSSCGGNSISDAPPLGSFSSGAASEINAGNALLVARIANLAVVRYLAYRDLTAVINDRALAASPAVPASVNCGGAADGQLGIAALSANAFSVTLQACRAAADVVLESGVVGINNFVRASGGTSVSFDTAPDAIRITDASGTGIVSGRVAYQRTLVSTAASQGQSEAHSGQLDYTQGGRTDQYRNIAVTTGEVTGGATPGVAVAISRLEIVTPRVGVTRLQVVTPGPLTFGTSPAPGSSDVLLATSTADGSLVQVDYVGTTAFRLRAWDNRGNPLLDVTKNASDPDVLAADAAASG
ncbi:MAG TPA: hypothetical protein VJ652_21140 [Noviherbaspirillum sp.]|nr:hypothetical protein [Noviherbaspirillum sp.]